MIVMAPLYPIQPVESLPIKHDLKYVGNIDRAEHVEDVSIRVESLNELQHLGRSNDEPRASLLTLPVEIRLRIYELAYNATFLHSKLNWEKGLRLRLRGTSGTSSPSIRLVGSPFSLLRVCHELYAEVSPMLPSINHVALQFDDFSENDMQQWLSTLSDSQVTKMRSFKMMGWADCHLAKPLYADGHRMDCHRYQKPHSTCSIACTESCNSSDHQSKGRSIPRAKNGLCDRSLTLDLNAFEQQFQAERFDRIMKQFGLNHVDEGSHREFHKACYLLRVLDGCVGRPAPKAHPAGRTSQCGILDAVETAIASFVSDEGDLNVTRENITLLHRATMRGTNF